MRAKSGVLRKSRDRSHFTEERRNTGANRNSILTAGKQRTLRQKSRHHEKDCCLHYDRIPGRARMIFNSAVFLYFAIIVLIAYHLMGKLPGGRRWQNLFLLAASYFFYGWWDWLYLGLIILSTFIDYFASRSIASTTTAGQKKLFLTISIFSNLGILFLFKYFDFFSESAVQALNMLYSLTGLELLHINENSLLLHVLLPVGISFYTFQTMSYTIDVFRGQIEAERDPLDFALFVCFFPQLVAGPIERANDLLKQMKVERSVGSFEIRAGLWHLLLGYFMKVSVADHLSDLVATIYLPSSTAYNENPSLAAGNGGAHIALATIAFTFQVYCDFAGYSNIARGIAFLMGFRLVENFNAPEIARTPADLYNRWHMSLNRWFIDYLYIPLGGSRFGAVRQYRNIFLVFVVSGLWHGANWTFVTWGVVNGLVLVGYLATSRNLLPALASRGIRFPALPEILRWPLQSTLTFLSFCFAALFFRAYDMKHAFLLLTDLFQNWTLEAAHGAPDPVNYAEKIFALLLPVLLLDIARTCYKSEHWILQKATWLQTAVYLFLFYSILWKGVFGKSVIYFAF
jgi:D-alanyl-lipoteichoic acid acyltransferase DltB (MBOAT superfamily)